MQGSSIVMIVIIIENECVIPALSISEKMNEILYKEAVTLGMGQVVLPFLHCPNEFGMR